MDTAQNREGSDEYFQPICPFSLLSKFQIVWGELCRCQRVSKLPDGSGSEDFETMQYLTESLVSFNSMVWKEKEGVGNIIKDTNFQYDVHRTWKSLGKTLRSMQFQV